MAQNSLFVTIDVPSPFLIPAKYLKQDMSGEIRVTIYKYYNDIQIESVKSLSPIDSSISLNQHELREKEKLLNKSVYTGNVTAKHSGEISNKTGNYQIDITYSDIIDRTAVSPVSSSECKIVLPVHSVTSSRPDDLMINASNAVDKRNNTRWAEPSPAWITIDLGSQYKICSLGILWYKENVNDQRVYSFNVSVSNNSKAFTNIFTGRSDGVSIGPEEYNVIDTTARYLNLTSNGTTIKNWVSINEINIFSNDNSSSINTSNSDIPGLASVVVPSSNSSKTNPEGIRKIHHSLVTFPWNVRSLDLSLPTYFWIVMVGVVASRFLDFILSRLKTEDYIKEKIRAEMSNYIDSNEDSKEKIESLRQKIVMLEMY